ncbi:VENN motif pre-toxin domain-containing protein [Cronobacter dublinensis]|nr:VENN motif pre-toxin domain-containing protein [Cronobacter dublinensis]
MGYLIAKEAYKKDPSQLNETEKQTVAALSTLAPAWQAHWPATARKR